MSDYHALRRQLKRQHSLSLDTRQISAKVINNILMLNIASIMFEFDFIVTSDFNIESIYAMEKGQD